MVARGQDQRLMLLVQIQVCGDGNDRLLIHESPAENEARELVYLVPHTKPSRAALLQASKRARRKVMRGERRKRGVGEGIGKGSIADEAASGLVYATTRADDIAARPCGKTEAFGKLGLHLRGQAFAHAVGGSDAVGDEPSCACGEREIGPGRYTANPGLSRRQKGVRAEDIVGRRVR